MRLQLIAVASACATAGAGAAQADPDPARAAAHVSVYADDDDMTVVSPGAGAQLPVTDTMTADVALIADTVSGASVDVVTSASSRAVREQREELSADLIARLPHYTRATARVIGSHEHDDDVVFAWALFEAELADRNLDVELGWGHGEARLTAVGDGAFHAHRRDDHATLRLTQVLGRSTYGDLLVDLARTDGYQASPYRKVAIGDAMSPTVTRVGEVTPRLRHAGAVALRLRHALGEHWTVHGGYRIARDDWDVTSHTGDLLAAVDLDGGRWRIGGSLRGYLQSAADFWRAGYQLVDGEIPGLRTRDRTLGHMRSLSCELIVDRALGLGDASRVQVAAGLTRYQWPDDPLERARTAVTTTVAVTTGW